MKISQGERLAIQAVLRYAREYGYGNLISHLQTAWAAHLVEHDGFPEAIARKAAGGPGYPFQMQRDLIELGEWDETGERYLEPAKRKTKTRKATS